MVDDHSPENQDDKNEAVDRRARNRYHQPLGQRQHLSPLLAMRFTVNLRSERRRFHGKESSPLEAIRELG